PPPPPRPPAPPPPPPPPEPHYLPQLRKDILEVICKYVQIDPEMVSVQLEQRDGDISILELNVTLPETEESKP
ncbi:cell division topological specificity factor MinE, partial [Klebsiella variicola]|uniref:cell division topological specificity factor MinE n=1 Tax=Klebsiella variicola TaxID=244366 RepID=UPI003B28C739